MHACAHLYCLTHVDAMMQCDYTRMRASHCITYIYTVIKWHMIICVYIYIYVYIILYMCMHALYSPPTHQDASLTQEWCGVNGGWALAQHGAHCSLERRRWVASEHIMGTSMGWALSLPFLPRHVTMMDDDPDVTVIFHVVGRRGQMGNSLQTAFTNVTKCALLKEVGKQSSNLRTNQIVIP